jgi:hypothetical protein
MYARVKALLAKQAGLITHAQALECGLRPSQVMSLRKRGDIVWMVRGVYADGELWRSLDELYGRPLLRARAVAMSKHRTWLMSHDSSAFVLEMPLIDPGRSDVHLTRPGYGTAWTRYGVAHHYAPFSPDQVLTSEHGDRHLDIPRTVADLAREHGELAGLVAADWAMRQGVSRARLMEAYLPMAHWPGVTSARSVAERADPRAESPAETLGRDLVEELAIGDVDLQFPVRPEGRLFWCDIRVGNHVFEVTGKIKLVPVEEGGVATRSPSEVAWEDKKRARLIRGEDLGLSEIFWEDFWGARRQAAIQRLRADYETTLRRFGPDLHPRLERQAAELRERHGRRDRAQ